MSVELYSTKIDISGTTLEFRLNPTNVKYVTRRWVNTFGEWLRQQPDISPLFMLAKSHNFTSRLSVTWNTIVS